MTDSTRPKRVDGLIGKVTEGPFGTGSKSERTAVWLDTPQGRLVLRRKQGPSFGDATLRALVGSEVRCSGFVTDYMLLAEDIETLTPGKD